MVKDKLKATAICYWSDEDSCFIISSQMQPFWIAEGETEDEAWRLFDEMITEELGKLGDIKSGTTNDGSVELREYISPTTYRELNDLASQLGVERAVAIDYLLALYRLAVLPNKPGLPAIKPQQLSLKK